MKRRKHTNESIDDLLKDRQIQRLDNYSRNNIPMKWKCLANINHKEWKTSLSQLIKNNKGNTRRTGCPDCAKERRIKAVSYTTEEVDKILNNKNIERLGNYKNNFTYFDVKCLNKECNHIWKSKLRSLLTKGCKLCNTPGVNERLCLNLLKNINKLEYDYCIINICPTILKRYRIDFYFTKLKIAIEYNGIQHYQITKFGSMSIEKAQERFNKQQNRDQFVREFCKNNNIELIEIDGRKYKNKKLEKYILEELIPYIKSKEV